MFTLFNCLLDLSCGKCYVISLYFVRYVFVNCLVK